MQETDGQPRLTLKERQRQEREELILQIAEEVLLDKGYYNTSMDEIAARVGIAKGTLYHHFARKEDLVLALFERLLLESVRTLELTYGQGGSPTERLNNVLTSMYREIYGTRFQLFFALFHGLDVYQMLEGKHMMIGETMQRISEKIAAMLEEGKADGSFDPAIPTFVLQTIFFSLISPRAFKRLAIDKQIEPARIADCVSRVFFRGIAAPSESNDIPDISVSEK